MMATGMETSLPWLSPSFPSDNETVWLVIEAGSLELIFTNELRCHLPLDPVALELQPSNSF